MTNLVIMADNYPYLSGEGYSASWTSPAIEAVRGLNKNATFSEAKAALGVFTGSQLSASVDEADGRYIHGVWHYSARCRYTSPLIEAVKKGGLNVLQYVLQHGARLDSSLANRQELAERASLEQLALMRQYGVVV